MKGSIMKDILHIYTRVSTQIQQEEGTSLKTQKETGIELSKKLGMNHKIHNEGGMSSSKDNFENRPVLMNILKQMDSGEIKHLYVWNTDRLSRNQITWYTIRQKMVKNGVILYTSNGVHDTNDFMENMVLGILSEVSTYDNMVRTERSRLGKIEKVKLNYWRGGDCPYGYMLKHDGVGNRLVENEEESKWVKFIYTEYNKGTTLKNIKSVLESNNVRTRRGNDRWSMGSLQILLKNETYLGNDHFVDKKTKLTIRNQIPQLISNTLWEEVTERRNLKLLRKNQINRTKRFYLFRDFLICSCGTPMGGRIKERKFVQQYYCPLSERKFNNSYKQDEVCTMKRCLNIPTTDKILWDKIIDILGDTINLKKIMSEKTDIGKKLRSVDIRRKVKEVTLKVEELTKVKTDLEKGLVSIETDKILNKFPSEDVYLLLKKDLTKRYNLTVTEIENQNKSLRMIGNDLKWFEWIDKFGKQIQGKRDVSDPQKRELLNTVLDKILVNYDPELKVHILTLNFKIPVLFRDGNEGREPTRVIVSPPKSGRKRKNQNEPVRDYSTVVETPSLEGLYDYSIRLDVELKSSYLWTPPYSTYQQKLFDITSKKHENEGLNFKQISDWFNEQNYTTPRGKTFTEGHVWSIYTKKKRSIQRFTRTFDHVITDMRIQMCG